MKPKARDIVKLLYEENKEYERLKVWWLQIQKQLGCRTHCSSKAAKEFNIPLESFANSICGYIEHLQSEIDKLKLK